MAEFLIIGPSNAGKTALLATLHQATYDRETRDGGVAVRMLEMNDAMKGLAEASAQTIRRGRLPVSATSELQEFSFTLEVASKRLPLSLWPAKRSTASFTLWDGPGGSLFPNPEERGANFDDTQFKEFRGRLVDALKRVDGFMLCLDSTDISRALVMFESFPWIMSDTGLSELPCKRVCICLTKVDAKFHAAGDEARTAAEQASAPTWCEELLPEIVFGVLSNYCAKAQFAFGWTSVYGFLPSGAPNYDQAEDKLRSRDIVADGARTAIRDWRPFRVLDPFVWLAGGPEGELEVVSVQNLF